MNHYALQGVQGSILVLYSNSRSQLGRILADGEPVPKSNVQFESLPVAEDLQALGARLVEIDVQGSSAVNLSFEFVGSAPDVRFVRAPGTSESEKVVDARLQEQGVILLEPDLFAASLQTLVTNASKTNPYPDIDAQSVPSPRKFFWSLNRFNQDTSPGNPSVRRLADALIDRERQCTAHLSVQKPEWRLIWREDFDKRCVEIMDLLRPTIGPATPEKGREFDEGILAWFAGDYVPGPPVEPSGTPPSPSVETLNVHAGEGLPDGYLVVTIPLLIERGIPKDDANHAWWRDRACTFTAGLSMLHDLYYGPIRKNRPCKRYPEAYHYSNHPVLDPTLTSEQKAQRIEPEREAARTEQSHLQTSVTKFEQLWPHFAQACHQLCADEWYDRYNGT